MEAIVKIRILSDPHPTCYVRNEGKSLELWLLPKAVSHWLKGRKEAFFLIKYHINLKTCQHEMTLVKEVEDQGW
jgi:hypothetical protein